MTKRVLARDANMHLHIIAFHLTRRQCALPRARHTHLPFIRVDAASRRTRDSRVGSAVRARQAGTIKHFASHLFQPSWPSPILLWGLPHLSRLCLEETTWCRWRTRISFARHCRICQGRHHRRLVLALAGAVSGMPCKSRPCSRDCRGGERFHDEGGGHPSVLMLNFLGAVSRTSDKRCQHSWLWYLKLIYYIPSNQPYTGTPCVLDISKRKKKLADHYWM